MKPTDEVIIICCHCDKSVKLPWVKYFAQLPKVAGFGINSPFICECGGMPSVDVHITEDES